MKACRPAFLFFAALGCGGGTGSAGADAQGGAPDAHSGDAAGADAGASPSTRGTWSLTGVIRGIDLQEDARTALGERFDDGTAIYTWVTVSNFEGLCGLTGACPTQGRRSRSLMVTILGTRPGSYLVAADGNPARPAAGRAGVTFDALDEQCSVLGILRADSGTVTFSKIDLRPGGEVALDLSVSTREGPIAGAITAPYCP